MSDPTELDELQSGVTSGFYQRLMSHIDEEWGLTGRTYEAALKNAMSGPIGTERDQWYRLKNVLWVREQMHNMLQWPHQRIAQLQQQKEAASRPSGSRRGPGL